MTTNRRKISLALIFFFIALALLTVSHAQKATLLVIQGGTLIDAAGWAYR